jgi:general stress protein 26
MPTAELADVLRMPLIARLSVVDTDGFPHTVPLWFGVDGDDIVMISDRNTRKVDYLNQNQRSSICIGGDQGPDGVIAPGFLLKGICSTEEDPDFAWLRRITLRYQSGEEAQKSIEQWRTQLDIMLIRLRVQKVIKVY